MSALRALAAAALAFLLASPAGAEDVGGADLTRPPEATDSLPATLTGTLARIRQSGRVTLGYRDADFPFSYLRPSLPDPRGYSIDLCMGVVDEIGRELPGVPLTVALEKVTAESRIDAVADGKVDLECGSTTDTLERRERVAFSPVIFVAGTKLLTRVGSGIANLRDLKDRKLVVTAGTTNEKAVRELNDKFQLGVEIVTAEDHEASYAQLAGGAADAFATDDVLLNGLIANHGASADMHVVGDFLTYEPYGLIFARDDPDMAGVVQRAFAAMAVDGQWSAIYDRWFVQPLPGGQKLNMPMSSQLSEAMRAMGASGL